jgi:hypothetical protein
MGYSVHEANQLLGPAKILVLGMDFSLFNEEHYMNFKLNTLVAAILLIAAGSANAAINNGQPTGNLPGTAGNGVDGTGELFLVVTDISKGYSFVGDLGVGMNGFLGTSNTSNSWSLGGFTAWTPFVTAIGGNLNNATYAVYAFDNIGATSTANNKRLLTTIAAGGDISGTNNGKLGTAIGTANATTWLVAGVQADGYNQLNDHDTLANGSSYTNSPQAYSDAKIFKDLNNNLPFDTTTTASGTADFWLLGNSSSTGLALANTYQQAGQFSLSGGTLAYTVAAVPEAQTYALMLSGLGLVAFMVRRRNV